MKLLLNSTLFHLTLIKANAGGPIFNTCSKHMQQNEQIIFSKMIGVLIYFHTNTQLSCKNIKSNLAK